MLTRLMPKFSVITVTYNAAGCLEETIMSVITQTYHNIEYIIIDGKSTDETINIAKKYSDRITHLVSEPDDGLYYAMNKGMALATGDYLCFLNAGDSFHEDDTLANIVHGLHGMSKLPDIIYGETAIVDRQGHFVSMRRHKAPEHLTWKSFKHGMMVCHQAFLANKTLLEPYDTTYRFSADFDWCIRMMKKADDIHNSHMTIIDYCNVGMTTRNHKASLIERFRIMCRHYGFMTSVMLHVWFAIRLALRLEKPRPAN